MATYTKEKDVESTLEEDPQAREAMKEVLGDEVGLALREEMTNIIPVSKGGSNTVRNVQLEDGSLAWLVWAGNRKGMGRTLNPGP